MVRIVITIYWHFSSPALEHRSWRRQERVDVSLLQGVMSRRFKNVPTLTFQVHSRSSQLHARASRVRDRRHDYSSRM